jgi:hypothetical protein
MLIDSVNLDELEELVEYGRKLSPSQEKVLVELREKRRLRQAGLEQPPPPAAGGAGPPR